MVVLNMPEEKKKKNDNLQFLEDMVVAYMSVFMNIPGFVRSRVCKFKISIVY